MFLQSTNWELHSEMKSKEEQTINNKPIHKINTEYYPPMEMVLPSENLINLISCGFGLFESIRDVVKSDELQTVSNIELVPRIDPMD